MTDDTVSTAKAKIHTKLHDIEHQRQRLIDRLGKTNDDLSESARLIELSLRLLENPRSCTDTATTSSAACSTKPCSKGSTSITTKSPVTCYANPSPCSIGSSTIGTRPPPTSPTQARLPTTLYTAERPLPSREVAFFAPYSRALNWTRVLIRPLGWA
jgi:hypothetical protein